MFLQLPHPSADTVNAILADPGQPLGGIVLLLLSSVLKSVRFGGFTPLYRRPVFHEGKGMGGLVCAAHRRKIRGFPTHFHTGRA